ncbi:MAG: hypothetical protein EBZ48_01240 [Proteobacteria bacterium]|nr:hypothetical protein [Pseudomonadota bacterium]
MTCLWFDQFPLAQLAKVEFYSASRKDLRTSFRGKVTCNSSEGTFIWSHGVRALSLLIVGTKLASILHSPADSTALAGGRGSLAASLDYSLSKAPAWLLDMFGTDASGTSTASSLFRRINPERKRAGPVQIFINNKSLPATGIEILINQQTTTSAAELVRLVRGIELQSDKPQDGLVDRLPENFVSSLPSVSEFSFPSLRDLDTFFGQLHRQLLPFASPVTPVVGELRHAWWPLLIEPTAGSIQDDNEDGRITYATRNTTQLDLWVAGEYQKEGTTVLNGSSSNLPFDFWIYGDTVSQIFTAPTTTLDIEERYKSGASAERFDRELFKTRCLGGAHGAKLLLIKSKTLAEELRRHVVSFDPIKFGAPPA